MRNPLDPPPPFDQILRDVTEDDRQWFVDHPDQHTRVRKKVDGEFWPFNPPEQYVSITKVAFGTRLRQPVARP